MLLKQTFNSLRTISCALFNNANILYFTTNKLTIDKQNAHHIKQHVAKNSIMPEQSEGYAYGHYFPKDWSEDYIKKVLDPSSKDIERVSIVKSKVGQTTGKILIKFANQKIRTKYIQKHNEDYILTSEESHKVVILPFNLKTENKKKQAKEGLNLKNGVKISNLDFDITKEQLNKLAADYGVVTYIDINLRQRGINKGFASVYFEKWQQAEEFIKFIDGFLYRDRRLKAQMIIKKQEKQQKQYLKVPTFTFKANQQLIRRIKSKQFEVKN